MVSEGRAPSSAPPVVLRPTHPRGAHQRCVCPTSPRTGLGVVAECHSHGSGLSLAPGSRGRDHISHSQVPGAQLRPFSPTLVKGELWGTREGRCWGPMKTRPELQPPRGRMWSCCVSLGPRAGSLGCQLRPFR